jgi:hypothetical protein
MISDIEYALMAGASYISNRPNVNKFPFLSAYGWTKTEYDIRDSGFEAISFVKGSEIVISFAGTNFDDKTADFAHGNVPLAAGVLARVGRTRLQCAA